MVLFYLHVNCFATLRYCRLYYRLGLFLRVATEKKIYGFGLCIILSLSRYNVFLLARGILHLFVIL